MLTAALVCIPASPNIAAIKSEAPLITSGCSIKSSVELTKPVNFTHDLILDKSHTEWNDFKSINFKKYSKNKNLIIYDMRNIFSPNKIKKMGFKYFGIGR